jgi:hypothetical protein
MNLTRCIFYDKFIGVERKRQASFADIVGSYHICLHIWQEYPIYINISNIYVIDYRISSLLFYIGVKLDLLIL